MTNNKIDAATIILVSLETREVCWSLCRCLVFRSKSAAGEDFTIRDSNFSRRLNNLSHWKCYDRPKQYLSPTPLRQFAQRHEIVSGLVIHRVACGVKVSFGDLT